VFPLSDTWKNDPAITNELRYPKTFQSLTVKPNDSEKLLYHIVYVTTNNVVILLLWLFFDTGMSLLWCTTSLVSCWTLNTLDYIFLFFWLSRLYVCVCVLFVTNPAAAAKSNKPVFFNYNNYVHITQPDAKTVRESVRACCSCLMKVEVCQETRSTDCFSTCTRRRRDLHHQTACRLHRWYVLPAVTCHNTFSHSHVITASDRQQCRIPEAVLEFHVRVG